MGIKNYLIEGVSCAGKTTVCDELIKRGYHAIHGDRELAYQGDPETGLPTDGLTHEHHIWDIEKVKSLVANKDETITFFCGGSRNFFKFIELFNEVFILDIDLETLKHRLDQRPKDEWGSKPSERELVIRLHQTREDLPEKGIIIDATQPIEKVVDEITRQIKI